MAEYYSVREKEGFGDLSGEDVTIGHVYEATGDIDQHSMIRVIDQSGEDYLYLARMSA
jgi:hypothetical protein